MPNKLFWTRIWIWIHLHNIHQHLFRSLTRHSYITCHMIWFFTMDNLINIWWYMHVFHIPCAVYPVLHVHSHFHHSDVIMGTMASHITSLTILYSTVYSGAYQRKHQSSASLAFVRGIHRWPVNSPHTGPVTRKIWWRHHVNTRFTHNTVLQNLSCTNPVSGIMESAHLWCKTYIRGVIILSNISIVCLAINFV